MRVNSALTSVLCSAALLAGSAVAEVDAQKILSDASESVSSAATEASSSVSSVVESATSSEVQLPTFTVSMIPSFHSINSN